MKCIKCQNDSKYSDRSSGTCPSCHAKFAFEPKNGDLFTDMAFAAAIDRVSAHDAVRFTEGNLFYELARVRRRANASKVVGLVLSVVLTIVASVVSCAVLESGFPLFVTLPLGLTIFFVVLLKKENPTLAFTPSEFQTALHKWRSAHGNPAKLIQRTAPKQPTKGAKALPRELATYSFDRAVICDRPETVDLLLANNFHFENNCAILSVTHYPEAVFAPVLDMLRRNPRLEVYALHDATGPGHNLARYLTTSPEWFRGIGRVTDVGLLVRHAMKMRGLWKGAHPMQGVSSFPDLSAAENAWLSNYSVELASIRPEQIIKRLFRAMTQPGTPVTIDDGGMYFVGGSFGSDAGTSDGGGDSFG